MAKNEGKDERNYQQLKHELDDIIAQLQHESTDIDEAIKLHKQGKSVLAKLEAYIKDVSKEAEKK